MPYIKMICRAGKVIEVYKYHTDKYRCKGEKHGAKTNTTPECQIKVNQRMASRKLRWLMNANFEDGDYLVGLNYEKINRPKDAKEMQKHMSSFIRKLRAALKKQGIVLKYIYVREIGPKGAAHVHMVMNKCDIDIIRKCWIYGKIHIDPLYSDGQYGKIADYFIKYADTTVDHDGQLFGKRWYASRNLRQPKVTKQVISNVHTYSQHPNVIKGYYVSEEIEGINKFGYGYYSYTLHWLGNEPPPDWREGE